MSISSTSFSFIGVPLTFFLPLALLILFFLFVIVWFHTDDKRELCPSRELMIRLPGQSISNEIDQLYNKVVVDLLGMFLFVFLWIFLALKALAIANLLSPILAVLMACWMIRTYLVIRRIRGLRLKQMCEQITGQSLQSLIANGYMLFHDILLKDGSNLDHVLVGSNGVFSIEVISRKRLKKWGSDRKTITYDENGLAFPGHKPDPEWIRIGEERAKLLQHWLSAEMGQLVRVIPVIALPGWSVELKMRENPPVLSTKQLCPFILNYGVQSLWEEEIQKITNVLKRGNLRHSDSQKLPKAV